MFEHLCSNVLASVKMQDREALYEKVIPWMRELR
jgi:hypothetical protein